MEKYPEEKIVLSLPPSVNKAFIISKYGRRIIHTNEYRDWIEAASWIVASFCQRNRLRPITYHLPVFIYFYLSNMNMDSHNLKKALFDSLEQGGLFKNDKYIMDRTMHISLDKDNPRVEIQLPSHLHAQ